MLASDRIVKPIHRMVGKGKVEMATAEAMAEAGEELAAEGLFQVAEGVADIGAAEYVEDVAGKA